MLTKSVGSAPCQRFARAVQSLCRVKGLARTAQPRLEACAQSVETTVLGLLGVQMPFAGLAYFGVAMAYLFFGVQVSSHQDEDEATEHLRVDDVGPGPQ